jgi:hypothetical protein
MNNIILINGNQGERITKEKSPLYADKDSSDITSDGSKSSYEEESSSSQQCAARKQNTLLLYDDGSWSS